MFTQRAKITHLLGAARSNQAGGRLIVAKTRDKLIRGPWPACPPMARSPLRPKLRIVRDILLLSVAFLLPECETDWLNCCPLVNIPRHRKARS
jgi:hypothetical protein